MRRQAENAGGRAVQCKLNGIFLLIKSFCLPASGAVKYGRTEAGLIRAFHVFQHELQARMHIESFVVISLHSIRWIHLIQLTRPTVSVPTLPMPEQISAECEAVFAAFQRGMGFPLTPNFMQIQGHSLAASKGTWGLLEGVLLTGNLPRPLKEMVIAAVAHDRNCMYCEAAHLACCRSLGIDHATLQVLVEQVDELTPLKVRAIILFAIKCARNPQTMTPEDHASLRSHGLNDGDVMELIALVGLAVYLTIIADASGVTPDEMFFQI